MISGKNRNNIEIVAKGKALPDFKELLLILSTFTLTLFAWIFFRAESIGDAATIIGEIFSTSLFTTPSFYGAEKILPLIFLLIIFVVVEWRGRERDFAIMDMGLKRSRRYRWSLYMIILLTIYLFGNFSSNIEFIYFQF